VSCGPSAVAGLLVNRGAVVACSGSTGKAKGVLHTQAGYLLYAATTFKYVFDHQADSDVFWCTADIGWITGHTYVCYGPLANAATSVMVRLHCLGLRCRVPMPPGKSWNCVCKISRTWKVQEI